MKTMVLQKFDYRNLAGDNHRLAWLGSAVLALVFQPGAWGQSGKPIVDVRFNAGYSQIANSTGDEWAPTWADDGLLYTANDDGPNFGGIPSRSVAFGKLSGDQPQHLRGVTLSDMAGYGRNELGPDHANWKAMNSYCVDGMLYLMVARCQYPEQSGDPHHRHVFKNATVLKSTDKGKTWVPSAEESFQKPMFPGTAFGAPYFVWYGQDGKASVDNADKYVYAVSNNGHFEDGDFYILGRVAKKQLPELNGADWEFYSAGDGMASSSWTHDVARAKPILENPLNCSMTGMTYIPGLRRYIMVVWHYTTYNLRTDPRTINLYYEAPTPWGPWTKFKTIDTGELGWYVPIVCQKFQKQVDADSVDCLLFPTGNYQNRKLYKMNFIPITFATHPLGTGAEK